jgi:hypothetical protein
MRPAAGAAVPRNWAAHRRRPVPDIVSSLAACWASAWSSPMSPMRMRIISGRLRSGPKAPPHITRLINSMMQTAAAVERAAPGPEQKRALEAAIDAFDRVVP